MRDNMNTITYLCSCGQQRPSNESHEDTMQHEKTYHQYCGACGQEPCLVASGQACCHDLVKYGVCSKPGHKTLE